MKKTCAFVLSAVLALPAFAASDADLYGTDITEVYGETPTETLNTDAVSVQKDTQKSENPDIKFPRGMELGLGVSGTTGLNAFVGYNNKKFDSFWWKRLGLRLDFATTSPIKNKLNSRINSALGDDGLEIDDNLKVQDVELKSNHYGLLVDFYPFGDTWFLGGLRMTGGYMFGKMDIDAKIHGTNIGGDIKFTLNGREYKYTGNEMNGTAALDWKFNGPYLGTGFDLGLFYGFKIYLDAGVVFANKSAKIDLDVPLTDLYDITGGGAVSGNATLQNAYNIAKARALADAQHELDKYPYYPIVKMGFMYRF